MRDPNHTSGKPAFTPALSGSPLSSLTHRGMLPVSLPRVNSESFSSLLEAIVRSTDDAIITKNLSSIVTSWNPAATAIFGWEAHEMIGHSLLRLIPPRLHHEEMEIIRRLRGGDRGSHYETARLTREGSEIEVSMTVSPLTNARGEVIGATTISRNITRQRAAERSRLQLAAIVECSADAIITHDLNSAITSWNAAAERLLGYTAQEMLGSQVDAIVPKDRIEDETCIVEQVLSGKRIDSFESVRTTRLGEAVEVSVSVSPLLDESGVVHGGSQFLRDISQRKELERSLVQAEKLATATRLAAKLAHHVNNPLEALMNLLYLAKECADDPVHVREMLELAAKELERVALVTRQTLDANRRTALDAEFNFAHLSEMLSAAD
ncbi:PAS domain S-box-containing protein [Bryocella elongata]|uniref:histidine kinase n=1 Tax=Bryocella elongata TaxID=863522 RepID=A0A1H6C6N1_9BACT|nr:PAS domain S-box protein [Bryocella elongata]SEG68621.1 PAS domain S-box-containing protein [Bryocella elongata]